MELGFPDPSSWDVTVNEGLLEKLLSAMQKISRRLGTKLDISAENIFRLPQVVELRRKELGHEEALFLEDCFERTLEDVRRARLREGRETEKEIRRHVRTIGRSVKRTELLIRNQPVLIREKLKQRLKGLSQETDQSEERLAEESAYLAQRYDLAEEIVRLRSHLGALGDLLSPGQEGPAGKQLDFIAQELYREANTTNSKSQDIEIIKESLAIKGEVESIRQHIQNIE